MGCEELLAIAEAKKRQADDHSGDMRKKYLKYVDDAMAMYNTCLEQVRAQELAQSQARAQTEAQAIATKTTEAAEAAAVTPTLLPVAPGGLDWKKLAMVIGGVGVLGVVAWLLFRNKKKEQT